MSRRPCLGREKPVTSAARIAEAPLSEWGALGGPVAASFLRQPCLAQVVHPGVIGSFHRPADLGDRERRLLTQSAMMARGLGRDAADAQIDGRRNVRGELSLPLMVSNASSYRPAK